MLCSASCLASADICQQPNDYSHLSVAYHDYDESAFPGDVGRIDRQDYDFDLQLKLDETWQFGVGHRYVIAGGDQIDLQTNGHLHTLFFPLHRQVNSDSKGFRISVAPTISTSSNVLEDPREYSAESFQLLAALVWSRRLSERTTIRYGVCGDSRFGRYKVYPSIVIGWRPHANLEIELGFPTTRLIYKPLPDVELSLRVTPDGNEWHVKSRDMEKQSGLVLEALLLEWAVSWQAHSQLAITASVGRLFHNQYTATLLDDSQVRLSDRAVTRVGAALEWRF